MTTYQDPPLQSRRAARQGERPESSTPPFTPPQLPRTAAGAGEPLNYVTQNRPPLPGYDAAAPGRRAAQPAPTPAEVADPPTATFRPRDFSPEARTAPPAWAPGYDRESGIVDYHTQARPSVAPQAASLAESLSNEPSEQTLTRRELRQIRDAANIAPVAPEVAQAPPAPAPVQFPQAPVAPQQYAAAPAPAPSANLDSAIAEFDALTSRGEGASRRGGRRAAPSDQQAPAEQQAPAAPQGFAPQQPAAPQQYAAPQQQPVAPQPMPQQMAPAPLVEPAPVAPTTGERPVGHWTTQADLDDATQIADSTISRTIGSGTLTTNALVLPSLPGQDMNTGEVMLTGSINLPSAMSETGAHHALDESDIDHLLDPGDHQLVNTDSVPIRAIKAVSSHTGSRPQLLATGKQQKSGSRALTALIAAASVMVVVVVGLLIVAIATDVL